MTWLQSQTRLYGLLYIAKIALMQYVKRKWYTSLDIIYHSMS